MPTSSEKFSLAIVEIIPVGGSTEWGAHLGSPNIVGEQASDYISIPRVLAIMDPDSDGGKALLSDPGEGADKFKYKARLASVTKLTIGSPYIFYQESSNRKAFYIRRTHGIDDGYFDSRADLTTPTAVSYKHPVGNLSLKSRFFRLLKRVRF